jgi:hypothetical protein
MDGVQDYVGAALTIASHYFGSERPSQVVISD